jgi:hypothetical protein
VPQQTSWVRTQHKLTHKNSDKQPISASAPIINSSKKDQNQQTEEQEAMSPHKPKPKIRIKTGLGLAMMMIALSLVQGGTQQNADTKPSKKGTSTMDACLLDGIPRRPPSPHQRRNRPHKPYQDACTPKNLYYPQANGSIADQAALVASIQNHKATPGLVHLVPRYNQPHLGDHIHHPTLLPPPWSSPEDKFKTFFENKE